MSALCFTALWIVLACAIGLAIASLNHLQVSVDAIGTRLEKVESIKPVTLRAGPDGKTPEIIIHGPVSSD